MMLWRINRSHTLFEFCHKINIGSNIAICAQVQDWTFSVASTWLFRVALPYFITHFIVSHTFIHGQINYVVHPRINLYLHCILCFTFCFYTSIQTNTAPNPNSFIPRSANMHIYINRSPYNHVPRDAHSALNP